MSTSKIQNSNQETEKFVEKVHFLRILAEKTWFYSAVLTLIICTIAFLAYHFYFWQKIYPGIKVNGQTVAGVSLGEAEILIGQQTSSLTNKNLVLITQDGSFEISLAELELSYNPAKTAETAYSLGRTGNLWQDLQLKWQAATSGINLVPSYSINEGVLNQKITELEKILNKPATSSTIRIENDKVTVTPSKNGQKLNSEVLKGHLRQNISDVAATTITIPLQTLEPAISEAGAQRAKEATERALTKNLKLKYQDKVWALGSQTLYSFLTQQSSSQKKPFLQANIGQNNLTFQYLKPQNAGIDSSQSIEIFFDQDKIQNYVLKLATEIDQPTHDASFRFENGKVTVFQANQDGLKLDIPKTVNLINSSLENSESLATVDLPVKVARAKVSIADVNNLGIRELLGKGISNYTGSAAGRAYNIKLAASRLSGILIPPGDTFSFDQALGDISDKTGYQTAYIIENGRTIFGVGGGVCQVSTTFFRAALNAGLPILERHPHAYRVSYYEQGGFKPGMDATIYPPTVDLRIKNDTQANILIQAHVDEARQNLTFEFYGTSDDRKTEISTPIIHSQTPPPPDKYEDDPTLPRGTKKQVDFSAWGARTSFTRKVTRGSETLIDETFWSSYQPWQAIYKVGTKD